MEKQMKMQFADNYAKGGVTYSQWLKDNTWQEQFNEWMEDGNVIKLDDGYSTQDAQYTNRLKDKSALKRYFYNEFIKGQYIDYAEGGGVGQTKVVAFSDYQDFKYYVLREDDENYYVVNEEKIDHWKNADEPDRSYYYEEVLAKEGEDVIVLGYEKNIFAKGGSMYADGGGVGAPSKISKNYELELDYKVGQTFEVEVLGGRQTCRIVSMNFQVYENGGKAFVESDSYRIQYKNLSTLQDDASHFSFLKYLQKQPNKIVISVPFAISGGIFYENSIYEGSLKLLHGVVTGFEVLYYGEYSGFYNYYVKTNGKSAHVDRKDAYESVQNYIKSVTSNIENKLINFTPPTTKKVTASLEYKVGQEIKIPIMGGYNDGKIIRIDAYLGENYKSNRYSRIYFKQNGVKNYYSEQTGYSFTEFEKEISTLKISNNIPLTVDALVGQDLLVLHRYMGGSKLKIEKCTGYLLNLTEQGAKVMYFTNHELSNEVYTSLDDFKNKILKQTPNNNVEFEKGGSMYTEGGGVGYDVNDVVQLKNIPENYPYEIRNGIVDNKWKIVRVSKGGRSMYSDIMEDIFGYDIELLDTKMKYKAFVYPNELKPYINYAKGGSMYAEGGGVGKKEDFNVSATESLIELVSKEREKYIKNLRKQGFKVVIGRNDGYYWDLESEKDGVSELARNPSKRKLIEIIKNNPSVTKIGFQGTILVADRVGEELEIVDDFAVVLWEKNNVFFKEGLNFEFVYDNGKYINVIVNKNDTETYKNRKDDGDYVYFKSIDKKYNTISERRSKIEFLKEEFDNGEAFVVNKMSKGGSMYAEGGSLDDKELVGKAIEYVTGSAIDYDTIQFEANKIAFKYTGKNTRSTLDKKLIEDTIKMHRKSLDLRGGSANRTQRNYHFSPFKKGGSVSSIEKKVAEVNKLIELANANDISVVDSSSTWESPMKYKPVKYSNGVLYVEYKELDLYKYNRTGQSNWVTKKDKVLKRNMEFDNPLNDIAKMYRKALREANIDYKSAELNKKESEKVSEKEESFDNAGTSMVLYHEEKGNWFVPKGQVYLWLYDVEGSAEKLKSEEFDWVFYPLTSQTMAWQSGYIPPLKKIWTKKFQKTHKGSERLLGVIKAYLIDKESGEKELFVDMMSVNPTKKKQGIMSYMLKDLRDTFNLSQDQVTFSNLTDEGKKFVEKKTYADGGAIYPDLSLQKAEVVNDSVKIPEFEIKSSIKTDLYLSKNKISSSEDAREILKEIWKAETINAYEQAYILYLNKQNKVIGYYHHSSGGIDGTVMDVQMISGLALKSFSKGVIIAHNHPSGVTRPSDADEKITKQLKEGLKLFNILLLDSIILTDEGYFSFADEGLL